MAEKSVFGIDAKALEKLDFSLATERVIQDIKSDFILAPHFSCVFTDCANELTSYVKSLALAGKFAPGLPFTIDVPKKQRIRQIGIKRSAPNFVRPGGILYPQDRLLLQALADAAQPVIESKLNRTICYSHQQAPKEMSARMFKSSRTCWSDMQAKLREHGAIGAQSVLRADVASCFQNVNQHTLINTLDGEGYPKEYRKPLESMLTQMSTERSSRGILQGIFPSDLLGNFYLYPIDRYLSDQGFRVVRYVDDIYVFFASHIQAEQGILGLYPELRKLDLSLNEAKTCLTTPVGLLTTDPDLDALFQAAIDELEQAKESGEFEGVWTDYGFQAIWQDEDEIGEEEQNEGIELAATKSLFDQIPKYSENIEEIERFCLPLFARYGSDYALDHVIAKVDSTSSMSQLYFSYLSGFLEEDRVKQHLLKTLIERRLTFDWEYIWSFNRFR